MTTVYIHVCRVYTIDVCVDMHIQVHVFLLFYLLQIALGTVSNIDEAVQWMSYSFLFVRMLLNPLAYGISHKAREVSWSVLMECKYWRTLISTSHCCSPC